MMSLSNTKERIALPAMLVLLSIALLAAAAGYARAGFFLFIAAATPLPALVGTRVAGWLRRCSSKHR